MTGTLSSEKSMSGGAADQRGQGHAGGGSSSMFSSLMNGWMGYFVRFIMIWVIINYAKTGRISGLTQNGPTLSMRNAAVVQDGQVARDVPPPPPRVVGHSPLWQIGVLMNLKVYTSPEPTPNFTTMGPPLWDCPGLVYDPEHGMTSRYFEIPLTDHLKSNGTYYLHAVFTRPGYSPDPENLKPGEKYHRYATFSDSVSLIRYYREAITHRATNLLTGEEAQHVSRRATMMSGKKIGWWKPEISITLLHDTMQYPRGAIPMPIRTRYRFDDEGT